jgi:hypothetical protein
MAPIYITNLYDDPETIYFIPSGVTVNSNGLAGFMGSNVETFGISRDGEGVFFPRMNLSANCANPVYVVTSQVYNIPAGEITYEHSTDRNAYPDSGTVDGLTYQYLGVPFQNAVTAPRVATGSYVGTGTYGESNPNRLTFDFAPKVVLLLGVTGSDGTSWSSRLGKTDYGSNTIMVLDAMTTEYKQRDGFINSNKSDYKNYGRKSADGKTVEWYSTISADTQCNSSGVNFHHLAIG